MLVFGNELYRRKLSAENERLLKLKEELTRALVEVMRERRGSAESDSQEKNSCKGNCCSANRSCCKERSRRRELTDKNVLAGNAESIIESLREALNKLGVYGLDARKRSAVKQYLRHYITNGNYFMAALCCVLLVADDEAPEVTRSGSQ